MNTNKIYRGKGKSCRLNYCDGGNVKNEIS